MMKSLISLKYNFFGFTIISILGFSLYFFPELKSVYAVEEIACPLPYINTLWPKAGGPGEEIKIRGNRFGEKSGKVIFFPGIEARILNWTYRRIWVTVPESAKTGPVIVAATCGKNSDEVYFTVKH